MQLRNGAANALKAAVTWYRTDKFSVCFWTTQSVKCLERAAQRADCFRHEVWYGLYRWRYDYRREFSDTALLISNHAAAAAASVSAMRPARCWHHECRWFSRLTGVWWKIISCRFTRYVIDILGQWCLLRCDVMIIFVSAIRIKQVATAEVNIDR